MHRRTGKGSCLRRSEQSDKKRRKRARPREVLLASSDRRKAFQTGTVAYTLSRFVRYKCFIIMAKLPDVADLKSADLRVFGGSTPLPGTRLFAAAIVLECIPCMVSDTVLSSHARSEFCS